MNCNNEGLAFNGFFERNAFSAFENLTTSQNVSFSENLGIVHRFENVQSMPFCQTSSDIKLSILEPTYTVTSCNERFDEVIQYKCPCCRESTSKMLCVFCILQQIRINKVRDRYRALFLEKSKLYREIEHELKFEINFQIDMNKTQNLIKNLKIKIKLKQNNLERMRQRTRNMSVNNLTTNKNIVLLERKLLFTTERLNKLNSENELKKKELLVVQKKLMEILFKEIQELLSIYLIKRFEKPQNLEKKPDAWRNGQLITKQKPTYIFQINNLFLNDFCDYDSIISSFENKLKLKKIVNFDTSCRQDNFDKRQSLDALFFLTELIQQLALLIDCRLPYSKIKNSWQEISDNISRNIKKKSLFEQTIFKLNYSIIYLCIISGVKTSILEFNRPVNNFCLLINHIKEIHLQLKNTTELTKTTNYRTYQIFPSHEGVCPKLYQEITLAFSKSNIKEQRQDFSLDNIEEDWVNVAFNINC